MSGTSPSTATPSRRGQCPHRARRARARDAKAGGGHALAHPREHVAREPGHGVRVREVAEVAGEQHVRVVAAASVEREPAAVDPVRARPPAGRRLPSPAGRPPRPPRPGPRDRAARRSARRRRPASARQSGRSGARSSSARARDVQRERVHEVHDAGEPARGRGSGARRASWRWATSNPPEAQRGQSRPRGRAIEERGLQAAGRRGRAARARRLVPRGRSRRVDHTDALRDLRPRPGGRSRAQERDLVPPATGRGAGATRGAGRRGGAGTGARGHEEDAHAPVVVGPLAPPWFDNHRRRTRVIPRCPILRPARAPAGPAVCTIVAKNYLAYARALVKSLRRLQPRAGGVRPVRGRHRRLRRPGARGLHGPRAGRPGAAPRRRSSCFRYDVMELSTAVKPFLLRELFARGHGKVLYLDPDIWVFAPARRACSRGWRSPTSC